MSSTRKAPKDSPPRQERFASSAALRKGIIGNLVAKRCEALRSPADRELAWWLQELSLRAATGLHYSCTSFPAWPADHGGHDAESAFERIAAELCAGRHSARTARALPELFARFCLDPKCPPETLDREGFAGLLSALREYKARMEKSALSALAATGVTNAVLEALDFCQLQRGIVLLEGDYRSGKSFTAQAWCLSRPGRARYVQLSAYADETTFFRLIARSLGTASTDRRKAIELRRRVEDALRGGDLTLVIDEAEHLFQSIARPTSAPERLNYLIKDLDNRGIAVALVASRNFSRMLENIEKRLPNYGAEQFYGRLSLRKRLPDSLSEADLFAIDDKLLPAADEPTRMLLVACALDAKGRVGALEHAAKRARYFSDKAGRNVVAFADVQAMAAESYPHFANPPARPPRDAREGVAKPAFSAAGRTQRRHPYFSFDVSCHVFWQSRWRRLLADFFPINLASC